MQRQHLRRSLPPHRPRHLRLSHRHPTPAPCAAIAPSFRVPCACRPSAPNPRTGKTPSACACASSRNCCGTAAAAVKPAGRPRGGRRRVLRCFAADWAWPIRPWVRGRLPWIGCAADRPRGAKRPICRAPRLGQCRPQPWLSAASLGKESAPCLGAPLDLDGRPGRAGSRPQSGVQRCTPIHNLCYCDAGAAAGCAAGGAAAAPACGAATAGGTGARILALYLSLSVS